MKTKLHVFVMFWIGLMSFSQNTYVPDNNFEQALIDFGYDTAPLNDYVPTANISEITDLNLAFRFIDDLTGIEDFTVLAYLVCGNNQLITLDVSNNTALDLLLCVDNQLTSLDVRNGNNISMQYMECSDNPSLSCINVDDAAYSTANWTDVDAQTSFNEDCSSVVGIKQYTSSKTLIKKQIAIEKY